MKYDQIGKTYNATRMPDSRITTQLINNLSQSIPASILDVGAGTGNYTYELAMWGYDMIAVEPSEVMRRQGKQHTRIQWRSGVAEKLPVENKSVDGVICTLATHHFNDLACSFREMARAMKDSGKIVIFTADPRICIGQCWIADYFKEIVVQSCQAQPALEELIQTIEENTQRSVQTNHFPLPFDLKDQFFFSGWRNPEAYFDVTYRAGISSLANAPKSLLERNLQRLRGDLDSGRWHAKYGSVLDATEYDCGYVFLVC